MIQALAIVAGAALLVAATRSRGMVWPIDSVITSGFATPERPTHNGVDLRAAVGTEVVSPFAGTVVSEYWHDEGGNSMLIDLDNGYRAGFAHLSAYAVNEGERVRRGQVVAYSGNTGGHTTGPHLHFTLKLDGQPVDPESVIT